MFRNNFCSLIVAEFRSIRRLKNWYFFLFDKMTFMLDQLFMVQGRYSFIKFRVTLTVLNIDNFCKTLCNVARIVLCFFP